MSEDSMSLDFAAARENMVENQVRTNDVTDHAVQDAMRVVKREAVCPPAKLSLAYAETPLEYAPGYCLLEPRDISKLLQGILPRPGERALCIAAPYAALVLAKIGLKVRLLLPEGVSLDGLDGVEIATGDLAALDEGAPYDVIVVEGAVSRTPQTWTDMLRQNGRLGVVERNGPVGRARLYLRGAEGVVSDRLLFDATPPILPGFTLQRAFQF
jgi:protein-L-isoaspartate(D-aspartate) O-methyltransferase